MLTVLDYEPLVLRPQTGAPAPLTPMTMKKRTDTVTAGGDAEAVLKNAPVREDNFYLVPKVVE